MDVASINKDDSLRPRFNPLKGDTIRDAAPGVNWYINGNFRLKFNAVGEDSDGPGDNGTATSGMQNDGFKLYPMTELLMKF